MAGTITCLMVNKTPLQKWIPSIVLKETTEAFAFGVTCSSSCTDRKLVGVGNAFSDC